MVADRSRHGCGHRLDQQDFPGTDSSDARALSINNSAALEVTVDELPEAVRAKLLPHVADFTTLGFGAPLFMRVGDVCNKLDMYLITQPHPSAASLRACSPACRCPAQKRRRR